MLGYALLLAYLACGWFAANRFACRRDALTRLWLGLCTGLMMMMWLPVPFAWLMTFNRTAQILGLGCAVMIALGCTFLGRKKAAPTSQPAPFCGGMPPWLILALVVPLTLLSGYLQYTHILRPVGETLHVGQSTYGDLCLHLGIAEGAVNAPFPFTYTILPGTLLGYPFLSDTMVTSMILFGADTARAFVLTGTLMMGLVYTGFVILAWDLTRRKSAVALAFVLMFINGGLGFLYTFDGVFKDATALREVFTGFYKTPTNMPELNLRWVNVICDMMIPQRTLLGGWTVLLPALFMLENAVRTKSTRTFLLLGAWAGLMPMVHTHSFFALGLASGGVMICDLIHAKKFRASLLQYLCYAGVAALFALPQLLKWTLPQTVDGGSLALRFNWVNNQGDGRLIDGYFWFWIKNVGLVYIFMVPAALHAPKGSLLRTLAFGSLAIYTVAELVQFQPNPYDNNKLFYVAYMLMLPAVSLYLADLFGKLRGVRGRALLAVLFIGASTVSGALSIARETISDYQLFNADEVKAAAYIKENMPRETIFLTGDQHNNAVAALAGRQIVCGTGSYLYYHGIDYSDQLIAERAMLCDPAAALPLFEEYGVEYIYISDSERYDLDVDEAWFAENCDLIAEFGNVNIYRAPRGSFD